MHKRMRKNQNAKEAGCEPNSDQDRCRSIRVSSPRCHAKMPQAAIGPCDDHTENELETGFKQQLENEAQKFFHFA